MRSIECHAFAHETRPCRYLPAAGYSRRVVVDRSGKPRLLAARSRTVAAQQVRKHTAHYLICVPVRTRCARLSSSRIHGMR